MLGLLLIVLWSCNKDIIIIISIIIIITKM